MSVESERELRVTLAACRRFADVIELPGATVLHLPEAPQLPMFNRVVGLGVTRVATEADVDEALAAVPAQSAFYVAVTPEARPPELARWLQERGLEQGWSGMRFRRGVAPPPSQPTALRLVEVSCDEHAAAFGLLVRAAYRLPAALEPRLASTWQRGWQCWLAFSGDEPAATAALFVEDRVGYLGFAGTAPRHRRHGAQSALLAVRIARAAELGCDVVVTETGVGALEQPSRSHRNILRLGFQEAGITTHWGGRS